MKITEKDIHNRYVLCRYVFSKFDIQIKELGETFLQRCNERDHHS